MWANEDEDIFSHPAKYDEVDSSEWVLVALLIIVVLATLRAVFR